MNLRHIKALAALSDADLVVVAPFLQMIDLPSGASVVEYGDVSEDMYFVVRGSAIMRRGELVLGKLKEGDHFGELGLIAHRPRAATIMADAPLTVARLGRERFDELQALRPAIAVKLMSGLIITLGRQLVDRTESLHLLLNQRSLPRQATITMTREDKSETEVKTGSVLAEVLPEKMGDSPVVAALVDHRVTSLDAQLFSDVHVEPLTAENWEGERVLRHSLALLIVEAAQDFSPPLQLKLGFAVGSAQWMHIEGKVPYTLQEIADKLTRRIRELIAQRADFRQEWWSIDEALSYFRKHHQSDAVQLLKGARSLTTPLVTCGRIYALYNGPLLPHAGLISEFRIKAGLNSLVLLSGEDTEVPPGFEPFAQLSEESGQWLHSFGLSSVGELNRACVDGRVSEVIRVAEGYHEKRLAQLADTIAARHNTQIICVAGPSSSGKTTFIRRLSIQLRINGFVPEGLSLDDYYRNRDDVPLNHKGEKDFETLGSLNLELLAQHLGALLAGKEQVTAKYDFRTGICDPAGGRRIHMTRGKLLVLEGIHGLNPALLERVLPSENVFRIFIQPLLTLPIDLVSHINPSDLRLIRRIVRDRRQRGFATHDNIRRWGDVRAGEQQYIFPFVGQADAVFDTSLVYELAVLKVFADRYLLEVPGNHEAYATAFRLRQLLDQFVAIAPDDVPSTSILREFIGKGSFE
jgi:uridine kinase